VAHSEGVVMKAPRLGWPFAVGVLLWAAFALVVLDRSPDSVVVSTALAFLIGALWNFIVARSERP